MVRTRQGGSVLSFVIVAVILVGLLVAGAYAVRRLTDQSNTTQPPSAPRSSGNMQQSSPNTNSNQSNNGNTSTTPQPSDGSTSSSASSTTSQLPHTGPESILSTTIALGILSMTLVAYVRSRRLEIQL